MKIMCKITLRQMLLNKRRTIVTIIGVIISVAMFTAVASLSGSFLSFMERAIIAEEGDYHVIFGGVSGEALKTLAADDNTASFYAAQEVGLAQLPSQFGSKHFLKVEAVSPQRMEDAGIHVTEGRLPENSAEIIVSQNLRNKDGDYYHIGDTVTLTLGERWFSGTEESYLVNSGYAYVGSGETFVETGKKTYTVVGFAEVLPLEPTWLSYYTAITGLDLDALGDGTLNAYVKVKQVDRSIYAWAETMQTKLGAESASEHANLLFYNGVNSGGAFLNSLYILVGILFAIIFIGSIALIYNAFAISVSERSVNFGLLASVGATRRQKLRSVLFEAFLILLVAVPLGIAGGLLGLWGVFAAVNPTIASLMSATLLTGTVVLRVTVSPWALLLAVGMSAITVFVSAWIPAKRASRITPMEAIRQTRDIKLTPRSVKTSRLTRRIFGFEGELAVKNMKRNKKRYRIAISSFVISLVLFLGAGSFTHYLTISVNIANDDISDDVEVFPVTSSDPDVSEENRQASLAAAIEAIRGIDGVEDFVSIYRWTANTKLGDPHYTERMMQVKDVQDPAQWSATMEFLAVDDETLRAYCELVGADYDAMQDTERPSAILINDMTWQNGQNYTSYSVYDLKAGDALDYCYYDTLDETIQNAAIRLEAVTGETVTGVSTRASEGYDSVYAIISEKVYREYCLGLSHDPDDSQQEDSAMAMPTMYLTASDPGAVADAVEELNYDPAYNQGVFYNCFDITSTKLVIEQLLFLINTFCNVFIALISAIGIANIFNTISTSIILRKQEFAMLKSVGMTPRGFHKMLFFESLLYGVKSLLWGLPISFAVMGLMYWAMKAGFDVPFTVPWAQVVIGIAAIFAIVMVTVLYAAGKVKNENIIDGLRNTNL